jgi:hypothetical protein
MYGARSPLESLTMICTLREREDMRGAQSNSTLQRIIGELQGLVRQYMAVVERQRKEIERLKRG